MANYVKIIKDDGCVIETDSDHLGFADEIFGFDGGTIEEKDLYGNKRITSYHSGFLKRGTTREEGFKFHDDNDRLEATGFLLGGIAGAVIVPVVLAGTVVYGTGKLVYRISTIKKRQREEAEYREYQKSSTKAYFVEKVKEILAYYNRKLSEYKELLDLGILTEQEYDTHVQEFIKLSNQEIDGQKKYMMECLSRLEK